MLCFSFFEDKYLIMIVSGMILNNLLLAVRVRLNYSQLRQPESAPLDMLICMVAYVEEVNAVAGLLLPLCMYHQLNLPRCLHLIFVPTAISNAPACLSSKVATVGAVPQNYQCGRCRSHPSTDCTEVPDLLVTPPSQHRGVCWEN